MAGSTMLTIREPQMAAFERARWLDFVGRADTYVRDNLPAAVESLGPRRRETVELALNRGRQHGLESESDLIRYLNLSLALGIDFDRDGRRLWAREILAAAEYSPHTKIDLLEQLAEPELGVVREPSPPVAYEDEPETGVEIEETPDEEVLPIEDEVPDFEPESEEPGQLPEDVIELDEESGITGAAAVREED